MALKDRNLAVEGTTEKELEVSSEGSTKAPTNVAHVETAHHAAEHGQTATDM